MPVSATSNGLPGLKSQRTVTPRNVFVGNQVTYLPGGKILDGSKARDPGNTGDVDVLRAGILLGKITSGGKYAPSILGLTTNAEAIGSTAIEAAAGVVTELLRRVGTSGTFKLTGPATANGVVETETVTYSAASGTSITCTALTKAFIAGSFIQPTDGSETPLTVLDQPVGGLKVTDDSGTSIDVQLAQLPITGVIDSSQIIHWPSDTSLQAWIMTRLPNFRYDHLF